MFDSANSVTQDRLTKEAYSVTETARLIEPPVHPITIYRQIYAGKIKVLEGFGRIRIPRSELERFFSKVVTYTPKKRSKARQKERGKND
jgi:hypothetical protein